MKIGAHISVRNERSWLGRVLRYHLDIQKFDHIFVNDDASYDGTRELIQDYAKNDSRVIPVFTQQKYGFSQSKFSTAVTDILFKKYGCDYVFPIDADEFWYSEKYFYIHEALKNLQKIQSTLVTYAYDFHNTEDDNVNEKDIINRQIYCSLNNNPKAVFCRAEGCIRLIKLGNHVHNIVYKKLIPILKVQPNIFARFHYPYGDKNSFLKKVLNQVEGFIVSSKGEWLHNPEIFAGIHIWKNYMSIRNNGLDKTYNNIIISKKRLQEMLDKDKISLKDCLRGKVPVFP